MLHALISLLLLCQVLAGHTTATTHHLPPATPENGQLYGQRPPDSLTWYCQQFSLLNTAIRDNQLPEAEAKPKAGHLLANIRRLYLQEHAPKLPANKITFPVGGYTYTAVGGHNGSGYQPQGYNYYHGNQHKGHPGHDIFVLDTDQNQLDDRTNKPIPILSLTNGIVVATEPGWKPGSPLRGGIYLWVYDPEQQLLVYYAHNQKLLAHPGKVLASGDTLALLGRTGLNAYPNRSPTHLHLVGLQVKPGGVLRPTDLYTMLRMR